jgi:hypothetical protein
MLQDSTKDHIMYNLEKNGVLDNLKVIITHY